MKKTLEEHFSVPMVCAVCTKCAYSPIHKQCQHGGPFDGYTTVKPEKPRSQGFKDT